MPVTEKTLLDHVIKRNNVNVIGEGTQTMLFAHGFGCDQHMWRYLVPAFEKDYRIVLFDYVGAGGSERSAYLESRYSTLNGYADDVLEICKALNLKKIIFIGHSVSSMIGVLAANRHPELFSDLIFIGPSPRYINDEGYFGGFDRKDIADLLDTMDKNYVGWANFLGSTIMQNADRPELAEELTASFCSTDPKIARRFAEVTFFADNRDDLFNVRVPSLIMQCSDDLIAPLEVGEYLVKKIPLSSLKVMKATGHCPHMSSPEETIDVIKEYLKKTE